MPEKSRSETSAEDNQPKNKIVYQHHTTLRHARLANKMTQRSLADALEVDETTIRRWEKGLRKPRLEIQDQLCQILQVSPEELGFLSPAETDSDGLGDPSVRTSPLPVHTSSQELVIPHENRHAPPRRKFPLLPRNRRDANRARMLQRVHARWISKFLDPLSQTPLIPLRFEQLYTHALASPWQTKPLEAYETPASTLLPAGTNITEIYDTAGGELLILGEAGAGKSTLLTGLLRSLLERARRDDAHPIPVIFQLTSWAQQQSPLAEWLAESLHTNYQVPKDLAHSWIETDQILPLLDELDEVEQHEACIEAINQFRVNHGFVPLVVCSRHEDYFHASLRLILTNAIVIQPLTKEQIDEYIVAYGNQNLEPVHTALQRDPVLREMLQTPLMLSIIIYTYQQDFSLLDVKERDMMHSSMVPRRQLVLKQYVKRLLHHHRPLPYSPEQVETWLAWLAWHMGEHKQTEFYLERLQPAWFDTHSIRLRYQRTITRLIFGIECAVFAGLGALLRGGEKHGIVGVQWGIFGLFSQAPGNTVLGWMAPGLGGGLQGGGTLGIIAAIVFWLVTLLSGTQTIPNITPKVIWHGLRAGLRAGLRIGLIIAMVGIPLFSFTGGLQHGLIYGIGMGIYSGMSIGLLNGFMVGLRTDLPQKRPKISLLNRCGNGIVFGLCAGLAFALVDQLLNLKESSTLTYGLVVFIFFFLSFGLGSGTNLILGLGTHIQPAETVSWSWLPVLQDFRITLKKAAILAGVTFVSVSVVIFCMSSAFMNIRYGAQYALIYGCIIGLIGGIALLLTESLKSGWSSDILAEEKHTQPNEGIIRSGRNALFAALLLGPIGGLASGLACGFGFGLLAHLSTWLIMGSAFAMIIGLLFAIEFAIMNGGIAWMEHYVLRWYLWRAGHMPLNYIRFLDSMAERTLLRKLGGGYMFRHRFLLDYFADQYRPTISTTASTDGSTSPSTTSHAIIAVEKS